MFWNKLPENFFQEAKNAIPKHTPDICLIEQSATHLVFDYGDQRSYGSHVSTAFTQERLSMWQQNSMDGAPPIVLKAWGDVISEVPRAKIGGDLYLMSTEELVYLDKHRENGVVFQRKRVPLNVPDFRNGDTPLNIRAWMYYGCKEHWGESIAWNQTFHRGRGGEFSVAPTYRDDRRWVGNYFKYAWRDAKPSTKCYIHYHQGLIDPSPSVVPTPKVEPIVIHVKDHVSSS